MLEQRAGSDDVWTTLHAKVEGGSMSGADTGNGALGAFRLSQLYTKAGNVLLRDVTWQIGTLEPEFGTLGLYDMWIARIFSETVGLSVGSSSTRKLALPHMPASARLKPASTLWMGTLPHEAAALHAEIERLRRERKATLDKLARCLRDLEPRIELPEDVRLAAKRPLERMMALG